MQMLDLTTPRAMPAGASTGDTASLEARVRRIETYLQLTPDDNGASGPHDNTCRDQVEREREHEAYGHQPKLGSSGY